MPWTVTSNFFRSSAKAYLLKSFINWSIWSLICCKFKPFRSFSIFCWVSSTPGNFSRISLMRLRSLVDSYGPAGRGGGRVEVGSDAPLPSSILPIIARRAANSLSNVSQSTFSAIYFSSSFSFFINSSTSPDEELASVFSISLSLSMSCCILSNSSLMSFSFLSDIPCRSFICLNNSAS